MESSSNEILAEIEESDHDLVVVGSWPVRDAFRNYAIGNVMREIVNRTDRPVLVIRSDIEPASLKQRLRNVVKKLGGKTRRQSDGKKPTNPKSSAPDTVFPDLRGLHLFVRKRQVCRQLDRLRSGPGS